MVTQRQRVAVTLSDETRELVHRLAELQETSASKVVAGIVEEFAPTIRQLVEAMEAFKAAPAEVQAQIAAQVEAIEPDVINSAAEAQANFQNALGLMKAE